MNNSNAMIEVEGLTKDYGTLRAIDKLNFSVMRGEVLGFLGPNGAGKTTTMKILTGFISPTAGTATVAGRDVVTQSLEMRRELGYLPENAPLYQDMIVRDYLQFVSELRSLSPDKAKSGISRVVETCGLGEVYGRPVSEMSKGYRQRLGLAISMIHDPEILILDEPTSGLDPNQIAEIRELIKEIGKERTVILSTHNLSEVQMTCQRVIIIHRGKIAADGTQESLQESQEGQICEVLLAAEGVEKKDASAVIGAIDGVRRVEEMKGIEENAVGFKAHADAGGDPRPAIFRAAVDNGWTMLELKRESVNLEQIFRQLTLEDGGGRPHKEGD